MTNLPARLSTLEQEISALTEKLAPCGVDEVGKCIASLMDAGMMIPASIQSEDPIEEYRIALKGVPLHGLRTVFVRLKRGEYELQNRSFLPIPSEMAAMANLECRSLREERMRASEMIKAARENAEFGSPTLSRFGLKDLRVTHQERARELAGHGYVKVADGINQQMFSSLAKSRGLPAGCVLLWAIDEVWAPEAVARYVDLSRVESSKRMAVQEREVLSPERAAELEKMLALPDAKDIRAEQMAYRSLVENEVAAAKVDEEVSHAA